MIRLIISFLSTLFLFISFCMCKHTQAVQSNFSLPMEMIITQRTGFEIPMVMNAQIIHVREQVKELKKSKPQRVEQKKRTELFFNIWIDVYKKIAHSYPMTDPHNNSDDFSEHLKHEKEQLEKNGERIDELKEEFYEVYDHLRRSILITSKLSESQEAIDHKAWVDYQHVGRKYPRLRYCLC